MKSLYDEDCRYTPTAVDIDAQTEKAITPIFNAWLAEGYSPREIAQVMEAAIQE